MGTIYKQKASRNWYINYHRTTPTLDLKIQDGDSDPPTTDRVKLPQITAVGQYEAYFKTSKKYVRYVSTIAGTSPSFTYSLYVTA